MRLGIVLHDGEMIEVADGDPIHTDRGQMSVAQFWNESVPVDWVQVTYLGEITHMPEHDWGEQRKEDVHGLRRIYARAIYELILIEAGE